MRLNFLLIEYKISSSSGGGGGSGGGRNNNSDLLVARKGLRNYDG